MRNVSHRSYRENQNIYFKFSNTVPKMVPFIGRCQKFGKARQATSDNIIWRISFACWKIKATDKHSEYIILIVFARNEPHCYVYTYVTCLVGAQSGAVG
jgi:hypothetical protein